MIEDLGFTQAWVLSLVAIVLGFLVLVTIGTVSRPSFNNFEKPTYHGSTQFCEEKVTEALRSKSYVHVDSYNFGLRITLLTDRVYWKSDLTDPVPEGGGEIGGPSYIRSQELEEGDYEVHGTAVYPAEGKKPGEVDFECILKDTTDGFSILKLDLGVAGSKNS